MSNKILRKPAVLDRTGLSHSTLYDRIAKSRFPKPISLGGKDGGAVGWLESEVEAWIEARVRESRGELQGASNEAR